MASRMSSRRAPSRGRAPMTTTSIAAGASPAAATATTTSRSIVSLAIPCGVRASAGNRRPRSPSAAAPSRASATAWSTTSPSECPASLGAASISIPPSRRPVAGPNGWLSWPRPTRTVAGASACSTRRRSSGSVTLRFAGSPGIACTRMLHASSSAASSVNSRSPSGGKAVQASSSRPRRAPCGVWAAARVERSTVSSTAPSSTRLSVSTTGTTGRAAPCDRTARITAATSAGVTSGRAPSWTSTGRSRPAGSRASRWRTPAATDCCRVEPPPTT